MRKYSDSGDTNCDFLTFFRAALTRLIFGVVSFPSQNLERGSVSSAKASRNFLTSIHIAIESTFIKRTGFSETRFASCFKNSCRLSKSLKVVIVSSFDYPLRILIPSRGSLSISSSRYFCACSAVSFLTRSFAWERYFN